MLEAAKYGHLPIVEYLLNNDKNNQKRISKALEVAASNGHLAIVKYFIKNGASDIIDAFISAAAYGHLDIFHQQQHLDPEILPSLTTCNYFINNNTLIRKFFLH